MKTLSSHFVCPTEFPSPCLRIGDLQVDALFDSGGTGLSLPEQLASQLSSPPNPSSSGNGESLSTHFLIKAGILGVWMVQVGQYTFSATFVEVNSRFPR